MKHITTLSLAIALSLGTGCAEDEDVDTLDEDAAETLEEPDEYRADEDENENQTVLSPNDVGDGPRDLLDPDDGLIPCEDGEHLIGQEWPTDDCNTCRCETGGAILCSFDTCPAVG